jgi:hypothetical protein
MFIVLANWNNMSLHSDTLFWFRSNQSLFSLLVASCVSKKRKIRIYSIINHKMESYNMGKCRSKKRPEEQTAMHFKNDKTYLILNYLLCKSYKCLFEFPVSSTNKTDRYDIAEILLKEALNTINIIQPGFFDIYFKLHWKYRQFKKTFVWLT